jgi:hypothetical protein
VAIYAALGEKDQAFESLEESYLDRSIDMFEYVKVAPIYDSLRPDPRFGAILRRMNLLP